MNREDRKKQLIAQGAVYRAEILLAKEVAEAGLRPDTLARSVLHQVAIAVLAAFRGSGSVPVANLQTLLPIVMGGISAFSKHKSAIRTVARGAVIAGAAAGIVALVARKKKAAPSRTEGDADRQA